MAEAQTLSERYWPRIRPFTVCAIGLLILVSVIRWGGTARPGPLFVAGVALIIGVLVLFGLLGYWLYGSPLPDHVVIPQPGHPEVRRMLALFVPISGLLFAGGGMWDEAWHLRYGSFGDDFLWPPHFLMYSSLGMIALFAAGVMIMLLRGGDLRARFRADPLIGMIGLMAALLVISLPTDQIWHAIYGVDLTAWSLPHIWIVVGLSLVMFSAMALQLSFVPPAGWRTLVGLRWSEVLIFVLMVPAMIALLQLGVTEWGRITEIPTQASADSFRAAFWNRPEPLFPIVVSVLALFCSNLVLHTTRRVGAATVVAVTVALFRTAAATLMAGFDGTWVVVASYWLIIPAAIALDLWYASRLRSAETTRTLMLGNVIASSVLLAVTLPFIMLTMVYPRVNAATLPWMIIGSLLMGVISGWAGARGGDWMASRERLDVHAEAVPARTRWAATATGALALVYALAVILTARPPTA